MRTFVLHHDSSKLHIDRLDRGAHGWLVGPTSLYEVPDIVRDTCRSLRTIAFRYMRNNHTDVIFIIRDASAIYLLKRQQEKSASGEVYSAMSRKTDLVNRHPKSKYIALKRWSSGRSVKIFREQQFGCHPAQSTNSRILVILGVIISNGEVPV